MTPFRVLALLASGGLALALPACASRANHPPVLGPQLSAALDTFFAALPAHGVPARSAFALFLPEGSVHKRHLVDFRRQLQAGVRRAAATKSYQLITSSDRVFFLSEVQPPGWEAEALTREQALALANHYRSGTHEGWVAFHTYWSLFNRLAVGDRTWIDELPESIRADLSTPLHGVLRVDVIFSGNPSLTEYHHELVLQYVEVGSERTLHAETYPLILTYPLG